MKEDYSQEYEGPLGMPRMTNIGPFARRKSSLAQMATSREEFVEKCMEGRAANEFSEDFIRGVVDDRETAEDIMQGEADEELKRKWCEGIADTLGF